MACAVWGPEVWARAARARSSSAAGGTLPRAALRGGARTRAPRARSGGEGGVTFGVCARNVARPRPAFLRRPLSGVRASAGCRGKPPMARATSRCAKKNDASIPLHTLQALRALARIKVPGGASDFLIFFGVRKERKKISNLSTPFSQKKCARCARCAVPFLPPLFVPRVTPPLYQPPLPAPSGGPKYPRLRWTHVQPPFGHFFSDARGAG